MFAFDVIEEILLRSDAKDLVPWKRVCKSWYSLISSPVFVKAHLNKKIVTSNVELRIAMPSYWRIPKERLYEHNQWTIAGSSNGLVCFYRTQKVSLILLNNPCTREVRKLPMCPLVSERKHLGDACLGFAYDSSTDDYKVVMETQKDIGVALIYVLSLRSNTWKLIGEFNYQFVPNKPGILLHGALHWVVFKDEETMIISFDLSREEFKIWWSIAPKRTPQSPDRERDDFRPQQVTELDPRWVMEVRACLGRGLVTPFGDGGSRVRMGNCFSAYEKKK
nr:hypothetical protein [Tanacetum cinerariifolium]